MCKIHRIHYSIKTLKNSLNKITEFIAISRKLENATVCVSFFVGYNSQMFLIGTFLILAGNDDMHESLDEFEISPDSTIDKGVSCL